MRVRGLRSALLVCLAIAAAGLRATVAQPSITPAILAVAGGSGTVDDGSGTIEVECVVTNPNYITMAPIPTGYVYIVGVSN